MNYLKYIELSAENLQFYLWLQDYTKRFEQLSEHEKALSPEWKGIVGDIPATAPHLNSQRELFPTKAAESHCEPGSEYHSNSSFSEKEDLLYTSPISDQDGAEKSPGAALINDRAHVKHLKNFEEAFDEVGVKLQPCMCSAFWKLDNESNISQSPFSPSERRLVR